MTSEPKRVPPRQQQFIRFIDTVKKAGNEPALDELDQTLNKLVPPIRSQMTAARKEEQEQLSEP